jgi:saccharopine dehydrogenase (NAD+, L-lysine-forming)
MRILVVGAGGVGAAIAAIAERRDFFEHMVLADVDPARAERAVSRLSEGGRFAAARVDASDAASVESLAREMRADVVLNACDPRLNPPIFDGAYAAGCMYLDMAMHLSHPHPERPYEETGEKLGDAQFAVSADWEARDQLALVGLGALGRVRPLRRGPPLLRRRRGRGA